MRTYGIRIFVDDIDAARVFYGTTLGLPIKWDMASLGAVGFDLGIDLIVEATEETGEHGSLIGRFVGISIEVDDIDATYRDWSAKGVAFTAPPEKQIWGGVLAHFRDPAGNILTLLGVPPAD